jgi:hypothetical protein
MFGSLWERVSFDCTSTKAFGWRALAFAHWTVMRAMASASTVESGC